MMHCHTSTMWGSPKRFGVFASIAVLVVAGLTTLPQASAAESDDGGLQIDATAGYAGLYASPSAARV